MATELIFGTENGDSLFAEPAKGIETAAIPRGPLEGALPRPFDAAQVVLQEGQTVVHVSVTPGEVVELPFGPEAHFLAELGNGNLAIKVGDVVVILDGYAAIANPPVIEAADGTVLDIATILAATDPNIDIQTAAGPGGQGGSGADNTGAIFQQLGGEGGLGGFTGVGGQDDSGGPNGFDNIPGNSLLLPQSTETSHPNSLPVAPDVTAFTDEDTGIFGQLAASDADGNSLTYALVGAAPAGVTFTPDGKWIFDPAGHFDGLQPGEQTTVSFKYDATDGFDRSNTATVTIAVDGVNDGASFTGDTQLEIVENTTTPVSGAVVVHDLDHDQAAVATTGDFAGQYGSFSVHADGSWGYTLDNANPDIDKMTAQMFTTDTLTIKSIDGTEQTLTVKIDGANDPATITGDLTGDVTEDIAITTTGQIVINDPDEGQSTVTPTTFFGQYGNLAIGIDGKWTYALDNNDPAIDRLRDSNDTLTDTFPITSSDGSVGQNLVITIHGHNDAPVANADIVLTNAGLAPFGIPIAALLANDRDPEGDALQQTDWRYDTGPNGDLSHFTVLSTGNLQIEDNSPLGAEFRYNASDGHTSSNSGNVKIFNQDGGDLTGTAAHEILIGSAANVKIDGGGGNDLIFGGDGDETFIYHDGDVVRGGRDSSFPDSFDIRGDVLAINHDVDFTKLDLSRFSSIETLSLVEAGAGAGAAQSLTLDASDVMTLSSHSIKYADGNPAIRIDLEAVDQLYLSITKNGDGWSQFTVGKDLVVYAHETTAGDTNTADAFVVIHTPFSGNVGPPPPNVHLDQSAP